MQRTIDLERKLQMADEEVGKTLSGKYLVNEEWRRSGLGKIYRGTHLLMNRPVSLKILSSVIEVNVNTVNRFSAEARTVSALSHPNILNVTDFGSDRDGTVFIVFENAAGEIVKDQILRAGRFSVEHSVSIARQIASALSAAHSAGIVHRYLTSANVLLAQIANKAEIVKVMDFGAAQPDDSAATGEDFSAGDCEYAAPEQNTALSEVDERADIYSLGVILYEMLAGELPYTAQTRAELLTKQTENPPPPISVFRGDVPAELEQIVLRALAINPDMRYQKVDALAEDLAHIARDFEEVSEFVGVPAENAAAPVHNNIWKTAFVLLAGISLLTAAMIYLTFSRKTEPSTQLATDAGALPVQPLNPATGVNEQNLVYSADTPMFDPGSAEQMPEIMPGGDGYNPWANGGAPPPGAPAYPSGGQVITIPGDGSGSQFMPNYSPDGQIILIPIPANTNPGPTPKPGKDPVANSQPGSMPGDNPANVQPNVKPTPAGAKPDKSPAVKPADSPKKTPPSSSEKKTQSGKVQDTN